MSDLAPMPPDIKTHRDPLMLRLTYVQILLGVVGIAATVLFGWLTLH